MCLQVTSPQSTVANMEEHAPVFLPCKDDFMFALTINLLQYHIYPTNNPPMFS
jgi:hypothetical protein